MKGNPLGGAARLNRKIKEIIARVTKNEESVKKLDSDLITKLTPVKLNPKTITGEDIDVEIQLNDNPHKFRRLEIVYSSNIYGHYHNVAYIMLANAHLNDYYQILRFAEIDAIVKFQLLSGNKIKFTELSGASNLRVGSINGLYF